MASDREMKVLALQTLRSMIDDGMADTIGPEITAILNVLATEGTARQVRTGTNTVVNNFPSIRRQAVELLWQVGGNGAEEAMMGVIREDPEPMVLAEAVYGLGMMELENPEEVADHFVLMLRRWNAMPSPDNNLAFATLLSVEKLAQQNLEVGANPELINALLGIASGNYIREVRLKSIDVISGLRDRN
ncbi:MAG: HEAT repeat domain-containing protein [Spirochaeta sp.]